MIVPEILKLKNFSDLKILEGIGQRRPSDSRLTAVSIAKICDGAKAHIVANLPVMRLVIAPDTLAAQSLARRLESWGCNVGYLPHYDDVLMTKRSASRGNAFKRAVCLARAAEGDLDVVVTCADSLLQKFPSKRLVRRFSVRLEKDGEVSPQEVAKRLTEAGYFRRETVEEAGEFALRGDILDVYSVDGTSYRVNFFGDTIEDVKLLDPENMTSGEEFQSIYLPFAGDFLADEDGIKNAREQLSKNINVKNAARVRDSLTLGAADASLMWAMPYLGGCFETLLEFFADENYVLVFDEPKMTWEKLDILRKEFDSRTKSLIEAGEILPAHKSAYITVNELKRLLLFPKKLSLTSLGLSNPFFEPKLLLEPKTKAVTKYYLDPSAILSDIRSYAINNVKVILAAGSLERARSIIASLKEGDLYSELSMDGEGEASTLVTPLKIETGVVYPSQKVALIGASECVGKHSGESVSSHKTKFIAPKAGDYVVHTSHGIGLCEGTTLLKTGDFYKEYIVLRYRDGDTLYVATDQMNNLQKFIGEENPPLNKLGGKDFEREKQKVKKSVRKLAMNLAELYAKRERQKGFKYSADTIWQKEFEDAFEYEETADQLSAIADIKKDMESGRLMDRLLVGDVGFGKTEVAFRAMFKTAIDGKQSVLLAPTTILARQHYENFVKRIEPFGFKCALLTRLQTNAEVTKALKGLSDGTIQFAIATHKALSEKVQFYDLGLLALDEEQRFGVEHKEKLKERYPFVNVLAMSATPIPRTLNMSLMGVRDISMLETAPQGRLPIQTYVTPYSDALVDDAVSREVGRGGQTLILLNNIAQLDAFAAKLRARLPEVRIVTAHGQMPPSELEEKIAAFYDKKYDVLVSTTIIENGIDLPDANTLIVINSGRFGLAQLYQLRGRVGRRGVLAHAYFTVPDNDSLNGDAEKRLNALLDNTDIGSGFKVALSDLSIRGAGNILGAEQSGHIAKIGYELYIQLLDEAIQEIRTGIVKKPVCETEMKVDVAAYIRDGYASSRDKLKIYKRISSTSTLGERDALLFELAEAYGPVDAPLKNLISISLLKNIASRYDVSKIIINRGGAGANFKDADALKNESLMRAVAENADSVALTSTIPPCLVFDVKGLSAEDKLEKLIAFFASASMN